MKRPKLNTKQRKSYIEISTLNLALLHAFLKGDNGNEFARETAKEAIVVIMQSLANLEPNVDRDATAALAAIIEPKDEVAVG